MYTPFEEDIADILISTDFMDRYSELVVGYARKCREETNLLQITAWSMLMDGLAQTGPWLVSQVKASLRNQMNTRVVNREGLETDALIRGG